MGKINFGRVLLGGLVAGLVINIGEYLLNGVVLAKQMEGTFRKMNVPAPGGNFIAIAVALTFLLGILIVWIYALIRPRLGPGPKTAIVAGLIAWLSIYLYKGTLNGALFAIPLNTMLIAFAWGLVAYVLGALAGAALYKEV
ncbi:MAG TPA: hypothetical protein VK117_15095 [Pyrinomonadaceae bacterium]|nr:hypothetical protein [Pyrinomonadaceae bacterium]